MAVSWRHLWTTLLSPHSCPHHLRLRIFSSSNLHLPVTATVRRAAPTGQRHVRALSSSFSLEPSAHSHSSNSARPSPAQPSAAPSAPSSTPAVPSASALPPPCVPVRLARCVSSLSSLPDLSSGLAALKSGRSLAAVSHLTRAADIVQRMGDPYAHIAVQRLLAAAYHEVGEWVKESGVRAALLEGVGGQWPVSGPAAAEAATSPADSATASVDAADDARLLVFQHASSYIALQRSLHGPADSRALHSTLEAAASDSNIAWRANARALQAIARQPLDDGDSSGWQQQEAAYQQAAELMAEANSTPPLVHGSLSPLARLLRPGDLHCLLAEWHLQRGDKQRAHSHFQQSAQCWTECATAAGGPIGTVPLMRGGLQVAEVAALCGLGSSSRAVRLTEEQLGPSHPSLAIALRMAALQQEAEGEAIAAEGLLRSSIAQLEAHIAQPAQTVAMYVSPAELRVELVSAEWQYAQLLSKLEWNGRSRKAESEHWVKKIDDMVARHAYLRPCWQHMQRARDVSSLPMPHWLVERLSI